MYIRLTYEIPDADWFVRSLQTLPALTVNRKRRVEGGQVENLIFQPNI